MGRGQLHTVSAASLSLLLHGCPVQTPTGSSCLQRAPLPRSATDHGQSHTTLASRAKLASSVSLELLKGRSHTAYFSESPRLAKSCLLSDRSFATSLLQSLGASQKDLARSCHATHLLSPDCTTAPVSGAAVLSLFGEKAFRVHQKNLMQSRPQSISQEKSHLRM